MYAFRAAHAAHDARKPPEERVVDGDRVVSGARSRQRAVTEQILRQEVSRDLGNLMNCIALSSTVDLTKTPAVARSIINYGLPDIGAATLDHRTADKIRNDIVVALNCFEPRVIADTVHVERDTSVDEAELKIRFLIRADLMCNPAPVPVQFVADLEFSSGVFSIGRL
jgi:type VI secretion system protein ImpF